MAVEFFHRKWFFLSNFYPAPVCLYHPVDSTSIVAATAEHAYQACKAVYAEELNWVLDAESPREAKRRGRAVTLRDDWERWKIPCMGEIVAQKFLQHEDLQRKMLDTGDCDLIEGNFWHDNFYGDCRCRRPECEPPGRNYLGQILMKVRDEVLQEQLNALSRFTR